MIHAPGIIDLCVRCEWGLKFAFDHSWSYQRLQVGFGGPCWCKCGELSWLFLCGPNVLRLTVLGGLAYGLNVATGHSDHKLNHSRPVGRITHKCEAPSWEAQTSQFLRLWCDAVWDRPPASCTPTGRSNHYASGAVPSGIMGSRVLPGNATKAVWQHTPPGRSGAVITRHFVCDQVKFKV